MGKFSAHVRGFSKKAKRKQNLIFQRALDLLTDELFGLTTVVSGNLQRSLMASTVMMPQFKKDVKFDEPNQGQIALVIATSQVGKPFYFGYQAAYAARWNYGFTKTDKFTGKDKSGRQFNQKGSGAVEQVAGKWIGYVKQAEKELGGK